MDSVDFFAQVFGQELSATSALFRAIPEHRADYRPDPKSRSAREIVEHILAHVVDYENILNLSSCEETFNVEFATIEDAANKLEKFWNERLLDLKNLSDETFDNCKFDLLINGNVAMSLPRINVLWAFLLDIIHHRGQLSTYIRPMGGSNPMIYGPTADS